MDKGLRKYLFKDVRQGKLSILDIIAIFFITIIAMAVRITFFDFQSADWRVFLKPWTLGFQNEGFEYITSNQYNYTPLYMYFLWFTTKTGLPILHQIKALSVLADFILAIFAALVVYKMTDNISKFIFTYGIAVMTPTIIMNSAMWGQCDSIYVTFILAAFYFLIQDKVNTAMILYAVSLCIKLQSIFFLPVLGLIWALNPKVKLWQFLYIPAFYFASIVPAWIAGRPFKELLTIYFTQAKFYQELLTFKYPNLFALFSWGNGTSFYGKAAVWFTFALIIILVYFAIKRLYKKVLTPELILQFTLLMLMVIPFFLPYMHDRYGYAADVFALIYAVMFPKKFYVPIVTVFSSFIAYTYYFSENVTIPFWILGIAYFVCIIIVGKSFIQESKKAQEVQVQAEKEKVREPAAIG